MANQHCAQQFPLSAQHLDFISPQSAAWCVHNLKLKESHRQRAQQLVQAFCQALREHSQIAAQTRHMAGRSACLTNVMLHKRCAMLCRPGNHPTETMTWYCTSCTILHEVCCLTCRQTCRGEARITSLGSVRRPSRCWSMAERSSPVTPAITSSSL